MSISRYPDNDVGIPVNGSDYAVDSQEPVYYHKGTVSCCAVLRNEGKYCWTDLKGLAVKPEISS